MKHIFSKVALGLVGLAAGLVMTASPAVSALPYTGVTTNASPVPAFNVFSNTPGNTIPAPASANGESDFLQGRVPVGDGSTDAKTPYADPVNTTCTNNEIVQLRVYVHNGASADGNDNGTGPSIAHGTKVKVTVPTASAATQPVGATISASNAATVEDSATINCTNGANVTLSYVAGSASQYSLATNQFTPLDGSIVSTGVPIQSHDVSGDVWGCWAERVLVLVSVKITVTPPTPPAAATAMCTLFKVEAGDKRTVTVGDYTSSISNATFQGLTINWGDNKSDNFTTEASVKGATHQYAADGTYAISVTVTYKSNVDGSIITSNAKDSGCAQNVTFNASTPPVVTPPTTPTPPATLVNTGAGNVVGLFAAAAAVGTLGYRWFLGRRLSANS